MLRREIKTHFAKGNEPFRDKHLDEHGRCCLPSDLKEIISRGLSNGDFKAASLVQV
jgi:hypothetical protein